jgi:hypothetical protein
VDSDDPIVVRVKKARWETLGLDMPRDTYSVMAIELPSGRRLVAIVPSGIDEADARFAEQELRSLADVIAGFFGPASTNS